jgi:uncharacterized protein YheU (UPF0270 family)
VVGGSNPLVPTNTTKSRIGNERFFYFWTTTMFIPWQRLPEDTLANMVDSYCTQIHGLCSDDDFDSLDSRRNQVMQALRDGRLVIRWSEAHESAWIVDPDALGAG